MSDFWIYFNLGLKHVLDISAYDHVLFLLALTVPYDAKAWKRILILVSLFTLGHTLSLFLAVFEIIKINPTFIEFLIPITILITAIFNLYSTGKSAKKDNMTFIGFITVFFGIIHGLGFSNYFNSILSGKPTDKLLPMFEFALGIEAAQIIVVIASLMLAFVFQTLLKFSKRDWILMISAFIIGVVIPMILQSEIWVK
ncbi:MULTISPECIES: HupE/UreJ family protein [unclassified Flavobacterium]|uniref:HupE/UreJ family protein n=1 Tax=unclassified Flavobacterium TaxID=196869 RepID=UPI000EB157F7|nr:MULTISPECIES: HupE/UreJ family protein [unclassified Flavobacterium]RKS00866.1 HupE/UreJ protein [Flavobacterium sp. 102]